MIDIVKKLTQENNLHPIAEKIFQMLDQKSLVQARGVSRTWKDYVDKETSLWDELPYWQYIKAVDDKTCKQKSGWANISAYFSF